MNIQELQFVAREKLPIKMVILNNLSLGMIRHFQEMYFESNYYYTVEDNGYSVPDFCKIVNAYGIGTKRIFGIDEVKSVVWEDNRPYLYEVMLSNDTVVSPKLEFGKPNQDQEPLLDRKLYNYLMEL
jgi:acetolactate synthase-1/2/3 large subunit